MVPPSLTRSVVEFELSGAMAWAERSAWQLEFDSAALRLSARTTHPKDGGALKLLAELTGYRALPPLWEFVEPETDAPSRRAWPRGGPVPVAPGQERPSIFIEHNHKQLICAPFSRQSFADAKGPHGEWGDAHQWLNVIARQAQDIVRASELGDMLATIDLHLRSSPGRFG